MKKVERILLIVAVVVYILRIINIPLSGFLYTAYTLALTTFYILCSVLIFPDVNIATEANKKTSSTKKQAITSFLLGFVFAFSLLGVLFYINRFPEPIFISFCVYLSIISTLIFFILFLIKKTLFHKRILLRCLLFMSMFLIGWLIQL